MISASSTSDNKLQNRIINLIKFYFCAIGASNHASQSPDYIYEKFEKFVGLPLATIKTVVPTKYITDLVEEQYKTYQKTWGKGCIRKNVYYFIYFMGMRFALSSGKAAVPVQTPLCIKDLFVDLISDDFNSIKNYEVTGLHPILMREFITPYIEFNKDFFTRVEGLTLLIS